MGTPAMQRTAFLRLCAACEDAESRAEVAERGGVRTLAWYARHAEPELRVKAAAALGQLELFAERVGESGGVEALVELWGEREPRLREAAALALRKLTRGCEENWRRLRRAGGIELVLETARPVEMEEGTGEIEALSVGFEAGRDGSEEEGVESEAVRDSVETEAVENRVAGATAVQEAAGAAQERRAAGGSIDDASSKSSSSRRNATSVVSAASQKHTKRKVLKPPTADTSRAVPTEVAADPPTSAVSNIVEQLNQCESVPSTELLKNVLSHSSVGSSALRLVAERCIHKLVAHLSSCSSMKKVLIVKIIRSLCRLPDVLGSLESPSIHIHLVEMLRSESNDEQLAAIQLAEDLSEDSEAHKLSLQWAGAIKPILALAQSELSEIKRGAIWTIASLMNCGGPRSDVIAEHGVDLVVAGARDRDPSVSTLSASALGRMSCHQQTRMAVIEAGGIPILVKLLREGIESQKAEALKALALIILHQESDADFIPLQLYALGLLALAEYGSVDVKTLAYNALQSLDIDVNSWRSVEAGGSDLTHLTLLDRSNTQPKLIEMLALNLLVQNPEHVKAMIERRGIERITTLLTTADTNVRLVAIDTLRDLLLAPIGSISEPKRAAIAALMGLLGDPNDQVKLFAVRGIESLLGNPTYHKFMTEGDKLKMLLTSLLQPESGTRSQKLGAMGAMRKANRSLSRTYGIAFLIELLRGDDEELKIAALSTLDVVLRVTRNPDRRTFCNTSGIPLLIKIIGNGSYSEKMAALRVMDAITIIPPVKAIGLVVQEIVEMKGIDALQTVKENSTGVLEQLASKVASTVEEHKERNLMNAMLKDVGAVVSLALRGQGEEKTQAAQKLTQLSAWPRAHSAIINAYGIRALLHLGREGTSEQKMYAAAALKELSANESHDLIFIDKSVVAVVVNLLIREPHKTREEAFEVLVNLAKRTSAHITDEVKEGILLVERLFGQGRVADTNAAVRAALLLSRSDVMVEPLCETGCVKSLVEALEGGGKPVCERNAVAALFNISKNARARELIAAAGGIPKLVSLLSTGGESSKTLAAGALRCLAQDEANAQAIVGAHGVTSLVQLARSSIIDQRTSAVRALKRLTAYSNLISSVVNAGGIAVLVESIRTDNPSLQLTAAVNSLRNIALESAYRAAVAKAGACKALQTLAKNESSTVKRAAELALRTLQSETDTNIESAKLQHKSQHLQRGSSQTGENKAPEHPNKKQKT